MSRVLSHYGLREDPWVCEYGPPLVETEDVRRVIELIDHAVRYKSMTALIGRRGMGKSTALHTALAEVRDKAKGKVTVVWVETLDKERIRPTHFLTAIIQEIGTGRLPNSAEARAAVFKRVVGEHCAGGKTIALILDDMQRYRTETVRALKNFREYRYAGEPLPVAVVMLGHPEFGRVLERQSEVGYRTRRLHLVGLSARERRSILDSRIKWAGKAEATDLIAPEALRVIERDGPAEPLELLGMCAQAMERAFESGHERIEAVDIQAITNGPMLWAMLAESGVSQAEVAREAGLSPSLVAAVKRGKASASATAATTEAMRAVLAAQRAAARNQRPRAPGQAEHTGTEG